MWASTMYRMTALIAAGANFVSEGAGKFLLVDVKQAGGRARKKAGVWRRRLRYDAEITLPRRYYHTATGFPGEPVAPTSLSGAQANRNS